MPFSIKLNLIVLMDMLRDLKRACIPKKLTFERRRRNADGSVTFYFKPVHPIPYRAGQYGIWLLPRFIKGKPARLFTIAAAPGSRYLELTTRISHSDFKQKLNHLRAGEAVYLCGPVGRFTLPAPPATDVVFIAGGIGITPFHAMLQSLDTESTRRVTLLYVSSTAQPVYHDELEKLAGKSYFIGRDVFALVLAKTTQEMPAHTTYYVSGPPSFVRSVVRQLHILGIQRIKYDGFLGYK